MPDQEDQEKNSSFKKALILRISFLIIYFFILLYFFFLLSNIGINPYIVLLILIFLFLIAVGPVLSGIKRSIYSQMFPNRKKHAKKESRTFFSKKSPPKILQSTNRKIDLNISYRKPIIRKCKKCGMIVANFVKKCPQCGEIIID